MYVISTKNNSRLKARATRLPMPRTRLYSKNDAAIVAIAALSTAGVEPGWGESPASLAAAGGLGLALGLGFPVVAAAVVRLTGGGQRARPQDWNSLRADRERNRRSR